MNTQELQQKLVEYVRNSVLLGQVEHALRIQNKLEELGIFSDTKRSHYRPMKLDEMEAMLEYAKNRLDYSGLSLFQQEQVLKVCQAQIEQEIVHDEGLQVVARSQRNRTITIDLPYEGANLEANLRFNNPNFPIYIGGLPDLLSAHIAVVNGRLVLVDDRGKVVETLEHRVILTTEYGHPEISLVMWLQKPSPYYFSGTESYPHGISLEIVKGGEPVEYSQSTSTKVSKVTFKFTNDLGEAYEITLP